MYEYAFIKVIEYEFEYTSAFCHCFVAYMAINWKNMSNLFNDVKNINYVKDNVVKNIKPLQNNSWGFGTS